MPVNASSDRGFVTRAIVTVGRRVTLLIGHRRHVAPAIVGRRHDAAAGVLHRRFTARRVIAIRRRLTQSVDRFGHFARAIVHCRRDVTKRVDLLGNPSIRIVHERGHVAVGVRLRGHLAVAAITFAALLSQRVHAADRLPNVAVLRCAHPGRRARSCRTFALSRIVQAGRHGPRRIGRC